MGRFTLILVLVVNFMGAVLLLARDDKSAAGQQHKAAAPMILQEGEGDQLVHRAGPLGGVPFTIKVDSQFGHSEDFFVFTETLVPGQVIPFHKHHNAEEILIFEETGAADCGGQTRRSRSAFDRLYPARYVDFSHQHRWRSHSSTGDLLASRL